MSLLVCLRLFSDDLSPTCAGAGEGHLQQQRRCCSSLRLAKIHFLSHLHSWIKTSTASVFPVIGMSLFANSPCDCWCRFTFRGEVATIGGSGVENEDDDNSDSDSVISIDILPDLEMAFPDHDAGNPQEPVCRGLGASSACVNFASVVEDSPTAGSMVGYYQDLIQDLIALYSDVPLLD